MNTMPTKDNRENHHLLMERYRYILGQKTELNKKSFDILSLYQSLMTAIVGGLLTIFFSWRSLAAPAEETRYAVYALLAFFVFVALFALTSMLAGISAWRGYKREEEEILREVGRNHGTQGNFFGWYETYMLVFILLSATIITVCTSIFLIPRIN